MSRSKLGWLVAGVVLSSLFVAAPARAQTPREARFVHHVFFWLKNPDSAADRAKLIAALEKLAAVQTIRRYQIGQPAPTRRDVIDSSYSVSWTLFFDNKAEQDAYQVDPIHLKFVEDNAALWERVMVYDTEPVAR
ncbi:Dabb family protein [Sphingomonas sp. 37zxx]|uniref:Dabb family protein n=1 Tax=Sphingomonas sp. 37zxx TaxID=1550073 RepID=UPI00053BF74E|nr:Dabb family protein [Sphingomonas sp. 37zxx]